MYVCMCIYIYIFIIHVYISIYTYVYNTLQCTAYYSVIILSRRRNNTNSCHKWSHHMVIVEGRSVTITFELDCNT